MLATLGKREQEAGPPVSLGDDERGQVRRQARRVVLQAVLVGAALTGLACGLVGWLA